MLLIWSPLSIAAPNGINYQGLLTDDTGALVPEGSYPMQFWLFDAEFDGTLLWGETQDVLVINGIYNVIIGQGTPIAGFDALDASLFIGDDRWLQVFVDGEELSPRQKLTSVPYAMQADSVADGAITGEKIADDAVTGDKISDNSINALDINDGPGSGLDADTVDGSHAADLEESAEIDADITTHASISNAHHSKTTSFSELTNSATDDQIPNTITIDQAANADMVDGLHASAFSPTSHAHSSLISTDGTVFVDEQGDLNVTGSNPSLNIEASSLDPRLALRSSGTDDWQITKIDSLGDLRFYNNGNKVTIQGGTGNVGIGTTYPTEELHVAGNNPRILIEDTGTSNPEVNFRSDGTSSWAIYKERSSGDLRFYNSGDKVAIDGETGNIGIGTTTPAARLEVRGEVRTTSDSGATRLWGHGRPGCVRYGTTGIEDGLCSNGQIEFGLSGMRATWDGAAAACPAGTWVCTFVERGTSPCDTRLVANGSSYTGIGCNGDYLTWEDHRGWVADKGGDSPVSLWGQSVGESGYREIFERPCRHIPVWCCSSISD
jgi:hypothetical protein